MAGAVRLQAEAHAVAGRRLRAVVRAAAEVGADADAAERLLTHTRSAWGWAGKGGDDKTATRPPSDRLTGTRCIMRSRVQACQAIFF